MNLTKVRPSYAAAFWLKLGRIEPRDMFSEPQLALVRYEPDAVLSRHAHDEPGISVVLSGSIWEAVGNKEALGNVGDVVVKPAWVTHQNRVAPSGAVLLSLRGASVAGALKGGWRWTGDRPVASLGLGAARLLVEGQVAEAQEAALSLLDLLGDKQETVSLQDARRWLHLLRERIEEEVEAEPNQVSVTRLAASVGIHPGSLTRAFRRHYGCSVTGYVRRLRVRRAAALLAQTKQPASQIAVAAGYYDQSHLCRDFKAELGTSPSHYRRLIWRGQAIS